VVKKVYIISRYIFSKFLEPVLVLNLIVYLKAVIKKVYIISRYILYFQTSRISDGIVRISFVAGDKAHEIAVDNADMIHELCSKWSIHKGDLVTQGERFFQGFKTYVSLKAVIQKSIYHFYIYLFWIFLKRVCVVKYIVSLRAVIQKNV